MAEPTEMKEPMALVVRGQEVDRVVAWACGACGVVFVNEDGARHHCGPRRCSASCGAELPRGRYGPCEACSKRAFEACEAEEERKDLARYERAKKVPLAEYSGRWLYWRGADGGGGGEGYFPDEDALFEHCFDEDLKPPTWVWACSPVGISFDAEDLVRNACEEMHEDAEEGVSQAALYELQAFLDQWVKANGPTSYTPDDGPTHGVAIELGAAYAAWQKDRTA